MWSPSTTTLALALMALLVAPRVGGRRRARHLQGDVRLDDQAPARRHQGQTAQPRHPCVPLPAVPATSDRVRSSLDATRSRRRSIRSAGSTAPVLDPSPVVSDPLVRSPAPLPQVRQRQPAAVRHRFPSGERRQLVLDREAPPHGGSCRVGSPSRTATRALQHVNTRRWLHSHNHASPISHNQEVSCYGGEDESNSDDNWRLETQGGEARSGRGTRRCGSCTSTKVNLHSHQQKFGRPISGQFEVCGSRNGITTTSGSPRRGVPSTRAGRGGRATPRIRDQETDALVGSSEIGPNEGEAFTHDIARRAPRSIDPPSVTSSIARRDCDRW